MTCSGAICKNCLIASRHRKLARCRAARTVALLRASRDDWSSGSAARTAAPAQSDCTVRLCSRQHSSTPKGHGGGTGGAGSAQQIPSAQLQDLRGRQALLQVRGTIRACAPSTAPMKHEVIVLPQGKLKIFQKSILVDAHAYCWSQGTPTTITCVQILSRDDRASKH